MSNKRDGDPFGTSLLLTMAFLGGMLVLDGCEHPEQWSNLEKDAAPAATKVTGVQAPAVKAPAAALNLG